MDKHRVFSMLFSNVYPLYVQKAEKKGRSQREVDEVICWLTGYSRQALAEQISRRTDLETFFREAPGINPGAATITGTICGVRIEQIDDPLMRNIRYMDKLVDELAKGRPMHKILRASAHPDSTQGADAVRIRTSMSIETEVLEEFFDAVNRNDMRAIAKDFDPEIVRVEPEGFPTTGTYRGIPAVQEHISKGRSTWAEGACTPEKFLVNGDRVVVYLHVHVRLKNATDWLDARFADGFAFRDGRISEYLTFGERPDALKWAGIDDEGAVQAGR